MEAIQKSKEKKVIIIASAIMLAIFIYALARKKNTSSATVTSPTSSPTTGYGTVGSTTIPATARYASLKSQEVEGIANNFLGTTPPAYPNPYYDGGISIEDVPVETLPSGQQVQFVIFAGTYPNYFSKTNIYANISRSNFANGHGWNGAEYMSQGAIFANEVGSPDIYPMSLQTAQNIGMQQDITDLLFVDSEYIDQFDIKDAFYENGSYSLSPINPTVDNDNITNNGSTII